MNTNIKTQKALVIGGGIAGLVTARVLSEQYAEIVVIERDERPEKPGTRAGVPQSFHLHQVLPRGEMLLQGLFPGLLEELVAQGAFHAQGAAAKMINTYGTITFPGGDKGGITYSRGLLEWALRQRVQAIPNVSFLYHQEVINLTTIADGQRVTGAILRERGQLEKQISLEADLVIDASGRSSKLTTWLTELGYEVPEIERVSARIGYSTRNYKMPANREDIAVIVIDADPAQGINTGGVLKAIENDTWSVCLASIDGQYPATDAAGFDEGLKHLVSPVLAEALREAEPLTEPRGYRMPECLRHHYEQMERWPEGLLVLGDAFCFYDPIYGQGMTLAISEIDVLATCLREQEEQPRPGFELRTLKRMQDAIEPVWWRNTLEDTRWSGVVHSGAAPLKGAALLQRYFDLCLKLSTRKITAMEQKGEFDPRAMSYFMMNWLLMSPSSFINASTLDYLLDDETPEEKQAILNKLFQGNVQDIDAQLKEVVPDFAFDFGGLNPFGAEAPAS